MFIRLCRVTRKYVRATLYGACGKEGGKGRSGRRKMYVGKYVFQLFHIEFCASTSLCICENIALFFDWTLRECICCETGMKTIVFHLISPIRLRLWQFGQFLYRLHWANGDAFPFQILFRTKWGCGKSNKQINSVENGYERIAPAIYFHIQLMKCQMSRSKFAFDNWWLM